MPRAADRDLRPHRRQRWRHDLYVTIFLHDTWRGRTFDIALLVLILCSVGVAMLESVPEVRARYHGPLLAAEWAFTLVFTIEYALRLLRVFRVLRMPLYLGEAHYLADALRQARRKIIVFVVTVLMITLVVGTLMYLIEGPHRGFTSIPTSVYWAIVTITTVGYGDVAPETTLGRLLASALMIVGYGIIAVPTGIVTAEMMTAAGASPPRPRDCPRCGLDRHDGNARFCKRCGDRLAT